MLWDGWFSRVDALVLIGVFAIWLFVVMRHARSHAARHPRAPDAAAGRMPAKKTLLQIVAGLGLLLGAAQFVVFEAKAWPWHWVGVPSSSEPSWSP